MLTRIGRRLRRILLETMPALVRWSFNVFDGGERRAFFRRLLVDGVSQDQTSTFDAIDDLLANHEMSEPQRERLLRRSLAGLSPSTISPTILDLFKVACGGNVHHSQEGEDVLLERLFADRSQGFFVDVGAHHPTRFSNTYAFYKRGWRGINIDATPGSMTPFSVLRPEDINLEAAVSDRTEPLTLHVFKEGALNTFDPMLSETYTVDGWEMTDTIELQPLPLSELLDRYVAAGQVIDLLSVDVEGEDLAVLRSNNWEKYRPEVVIIEALNAPLLSLCADPAVAFLVERGYVPVSRLFNSVILRRAEEPDAKN